MEGEFHKQSGDEIRKSILLSTKCKILFIILML